MQRFLARLRRAVALTERGLSRLSAFGAAKAPVVSSDGDRAYQIGLRLLAGRELCEAQVRTRLQRKAFADAAIDVAIGRLRETRALDDRRAAMACARTEALTRRRGRRRVEQHMRALGFDPDVVSEAVGHVFSTIDEPHRLDSILDRRLRPDESVDDRPTAARLYRYLVRQGFGADDVSAALKRRGRASRA